MVHQIIQQIFVESMLLKIHVFIILKRKMSVSSARNLGIEPSEGAYITFVDSDDWVDSDYLEVLYSALMEEQADIAISTYKKI